jgi:hypothetical protein
MPVRIWMSWSAVLACYSGAGFHDDIRTVTTRHPNTLLVTLNELYPETN